MGEGVAGRRHHPFVHEGVATGSLREYNRECGEVGHSRVFWNPTGGLYVEGLRRSCIVRCITHGNTVQDLLHREAGGCQVSPLIRRLSLDSMR